MRNRIWRHVAVEVCESVFYSPSPLTNNKSTWEYTSQTYSSLCNRVRVRREPEVVSAVSYSAAYVQCTATEYTRIAKRCAIKTKGRPVRRAATTKHVTNDACTTVAVRRGCTTPCTRTGGRNKALHCMAARGNVRETNRRPLTWRMRNERYVHRMGQRAARGSGGGNQWWRRWPRRC